MEVGGATRSVKYLLYPHKDLASSSEPLKKPDMVLETGRLVHALVQYSKPNQQASGPSERLCLKKQGGQYNESFSVPPASWLPEMIPLINYESSAYSLGMFLTSSFNLN